jgi:hypothetical protein
MISSRLKIRFLLALAVAGSATAGVNLEDYTVRRGQTVSYIAFLKYGQYNDSIVKVLKTDNPKIENLDLIQVGSVLKIRTDAQSPVATEKDPAKRIQMASKKAVVTMVVGTGEIRRANGVVEKLLPNRFLSTGDAIVTMADGMAEIIIDNQSVLRLSSSTEIKLTAIQESQKPTGTETRPMVTRLSLLRGKTWAKVQKWAGPLVNYQIQLPNAIAGVHGTVFETEAKADSTGTVAVYQGEVGVANPAPAPVKKSLAPTQVAGPKEVSQGEWIRILKDGMKLEIGKTGTPGEPVAFTAEVNSEWVKMNKERDCLCD